MDFRSLYGEMRTLIGTIISSTLALRGQVEIDSAEVWDGITKRQIDKSRACGKNVDGIVEVRVHADIPVIEPSRIKLQAPTTTARRKARGGKCASHPERWKRK